MLVNAHKKGSNGARNALSGADSVSLKAGGEAELAARESRLVKSVAWESTPR